MDKYIGNQNSSVNLNTHNFHSVVDLISVRMPRHNLVLVALWE